MEEKSFRVLLDFTEINYGVTDLKYVWMYVSPRELKTILDFKRAVIKKFPFIQDNFKLFVRDGLLLENEKIAILKEDDTVRLQYENYTVSNYSIQIPNAESLQRNDHPEESTSSKETRKRDADDVVDHEKETDSFSKSHRKKRKREKSRKTTQPEEIEVNQEIISNELEKFSPTTKKRKKKHNDQKESINMSEMASNLTNKCNEKQSKEFSSGIEVSMNSSSSYDNTYKVTKIYDDPLSTNSNIKNNTVNLNNLEGINNTFEVISVENEPHQENSCKKRKRRRKRKHKEPTKLEECCLVEDNETHQSYDIPQVDEFSGIRKHVIYDSSKPLLTTIKEEVLKSLEPSNPKRISDSGSSVEPKKQNSNLSKIKAIGSSSSNKTDSHPKASTPFSKRLQNLESWCITPLMNKLKEQTSSSVSNGDRSNPNKESSVKMAYDDYPLLSCMPTVGTHLAYKTLELSENYCPEVTEYKEGIVISVDPKTEELEIELTQEEIKPGRTGKFEIYCEDEVSPPQIVKNVTINWTALIDPRRIS